LHITYFCKMKKLTTNTLALLLFVFLSQAYAQGFRGGIIGGLNTSNVSGTPANGIRQFGLNMGAFVELAINEHAGFRTEMLLSQKGARKLANPEISDYTKYILRINYIEVPLMFTRKHNHFIFEAGPSLSYLLQFSENNEHGPLPIQRPFNRMDFTANVGVSYELTDNIDMNWRFSHSIIPAREHFGGSTWWFNRGQYNQVISFRLIYWLN
jgi:hypothetical protein